MERASTTETRSWARAGSFGLALVLSFGSLWSSFHSIHIIISSGCSDFCHSLSCSFEGLCHFLSQHVGLFISLLYCSGMAPRSLVPSLMKSLGVGLLSSPNHHLAMVQSRHHHQHPSYHHFVATSPVTALSSSPPFVHIVFRIELLIVSA